MARLLFHDMNDPGDEDDADSKPAIARSIRRFLHEVRSLSGRFFTRDDVGDKLPGYVVIVLTADKTVVIDTNATSPLYAMALLKSAMTTIFDAHPELRERFAAEARMGAQRVHGPSGILLPPGVNGVPQ
jgi:hypothetical protein